MTVFNEAHIASEKLRVNIRRDKEFEFLTIQAGNTRIVISSDGFTGHKLQQAIAQAYVDLRIADEAERPVADATVEAENYGGSE